MKHGLILDGPDKGSYYECSHKTLYLPELLELIPMEPPEPLGPAKNTEYRKVWLERGTVYGWILK